jgi:hypothetical protein
MPPACVGEFVALAECGLAQPDRDDLSDQDLSDVLTAAIRLYAARAEARDAFPPPLAPDRVTATDVAIAVSEMIRVADLNMFDLSMWHARARQRDR